MFFVRYNISQKCAFFLPGSKFSLHALCKLSFVIVNENNEYDESKQREKIIQLRLIAGFLEAFSS